MSADGDEPRRPTIDEIAAQLRARRHPDLEAIHLKQRRDRYDRYTRDGWRIVRWITICDGRTCAACAALHGTEIALDDPRWPKLLNLHPGCRCRFTLVSERS